MKLTTSNVKKLGCTPGKTETVHWDDEVKGFGVRVKASGASSYVMCWKVAGEHRRVTIGSLSDTDFGRAKNRAKDIKADVRRGADPAADIKSSRLNAAQTFEILAQQFLDTFRNDYKPRTFTEIKRHLTKHASVLNKRPAAALKRADIAAVLESVTENSGPTEANRVRSSISTFFSWLIQRGHAESNPVIGTEKHEEKSRDRVLAPSELRLIWNALGDDDYGEIVKLLALTSQRESEIGSLERAEINEALMVLPKERTKNNRPHTVPLAPPALEILVDRKRRADDRDYLFGRGESGFSGWSKSKERLDARITEANGGKPIPHWTLHDLRRTFSTYAGGGIEAHQLAKLPKRDRELASGLGIAPHVVEAILNHVNGAKAGVAQVYNRSTYEREKRLALDLWASHLLMIVEDRESNVTPIRKPA